MGVLLLRRDRDFHTPAEADAIGWKLLIVGQEIGVQMEEARKNGVTLGYRLQSPDHSDEELARLWAERRTDA